VNVEFRSSFARDVRKIKEQSVKQQVREAIAAVEAAPSLSEVPDLKKLSVGGRYYRLRIGDYRIGLALESETVVFVRCLPRKDIYRYFP
jgi:mRNA interferase RelE/StbE